MGSRIRLTGVCKVSIQGRVQACREGREEAGERREEPTLSFPAQYPNRDLQAAVPVTEVWSPHPPRSWLGGGLQALSAREHRWCETGCKGSGEILWF